jgi:transcriptional regulator with XRE-family HTH domain
VAETFGRRLQRLRTERGISVGTLARAVEVSESAIRQLEAGTSKSASFAVGLKIAEFLEVDPHALAFGEGQPLSTALRVMQRRVEALEAAGGVPSPKRPRK